MEYDLKWESYKNWTENCIRELSEDTIFSDVTLLSDDLQEYKAHKIILSKSSDFFRKVLIAIPSNSGNTLFLKGIEGNILKSMLKFIYEGVVSVPEEGLSKFLEIGFDLKVAGIISGKESVMRKKAKEVIESVAKNSENAHMSSYPTLNEASSCKSEEPSLSVLHNDTNNLEEPSLSVFHDEPNNSEYLSLSVLHDYSNSEESSLSVVHDDSNSERMEIKMEHREADPLTLSELQHLEYRRKRDAYKIKAQEDQEILQQYMSYSSNEEFKFACTFDKSNCQKQFKLKSNLVAHVKKKHLGTVEKEYNCPDCPKLFFTKSEVSLHYERKHSGNMVKKHACNICDKKFYLTSDVKAHVKGVHDKIKDFECKLCDMAFSQSCNLKSHVRKMHTAAIN